MSVLEPGEHSKKQNPFQPAPKRVYVASSWRNLHQPMVVMSLRKLGLELSDWAMCL
jgi:hypothetical protein